VAQGFPFPLAQVARHFPDVQQCDLCKRAKLVQNAQVGFHTANPSCYPLGIVFIDFMGPLTKTKQGIEVVFVVMDSFSKFVRFSPVRMLTSRAVCGVLET